MEELWTQLTSNLKENPKATLVQTQEAGRGLVAACDLQRQEQKIIELVYYSIKIKSFTKFVL